MLEVYDSPDTHMAVEHSNKSGFADNVQMMQGDLFSCKGKDTQECDEFRIDLSVPSKIGYRNSILKRFKSSMTSLGE